MPSTPTALGRARATIRADRFWWGVLGAAAVGLVLRLVWVFTVARTPKGLYDPARYYGLATAIGQGKGYVEPFTVIHGQFAAPQATAYYPPGYPYFLGSLAWLVHHGVLPDDLPRVAGVAQALLGTLTVVLLGVIGRRVWSARAGVLTAALVAVYPNLVMHSAALLSETLFITLFVAFVAVLATRPGDVGAPLTRQRLVAAGVLLGLSVLVRPVSLAVLPLLAVLWWRRSGLGLRGAARQTGVLLACIAALVAPWTLRNAVRMHAFVPISTNNGDNLCIAYSPDAYGVFTVSDHCITEDAQNQGSASEVRHDHEATRLALRFLADDPWRLPWLVKQRAYYLAQRDDDGLWAVESYGTDRFLSAGRFDLLDRVAQDAWFTVLVLGGLGTVLLFAKGRGEHVLVGLAGLSTLVFPLLTFADARFKVPFVPFLLLGTAVLVARVTGSVAEPGSRVGQPLG